MKSRADHNQAEIVEGLKKIGCLVMVLTMVGNGCPDLLVGFRGRNYLIEIKSKYARLSNDQRRWHILWRGEVAIAHTLDEAIGIVDPQSGKPI
jgi:hypothetical protein